MPSKKSVNENPGNRKNSHNECSHAKDSLQALRRDDISQLKKELEKELRPCYQVIKAHIGDVIELDKSLKHLATAAMHHLLLVSFEDGRKTRLACPICDNKFITVKRDVQIKGRHDKVPFQLGNLKFKCVTVDQIADYYDSRIQSWLEEIELYHKTPKYIYNAGRYYCLQWENVILALSHYIKHGLDQKLEYAKYMELVVKALQNSKIEVRKKASEKEDIVEIYYPDSGKMEYKVEYSRPYIEDECDCNQHVCCEHNSHEDEGFDESEELIENRCIKLVIRTCHPLYGTNKKEFIRNAASHG
uniref:Uncharacterized protein n=1 Tax=Acrobeloides nanus TaxID=290746 RepID=A0A914DIC1_9BILA